MMMKAVVFLQLVSVSVSAQIVKDSLMLVSPLCDMNDRLTRGCARQETSVQNLPQCVLRCNADDTCVGASVDKNDVCFIHQDCPSLSSPCFTPDPDHKYFNKNCYNNGLWQETENKCKCPTPMIGDMCDRFPKDCEDLISHGLDQSGAHEVVMVPPGSGEDLKVMCEIEDASFQFYSFFKNGGRQSFNRTWQEYRDGFKIDDDHYWIGLESLHRLTNLFTKSRIRVLMDFGSMGYAARWFINFAVSDEASGYKISIERTGQGKSSTEFKATAALAASSVQDCFKGIHNIRFSTWDKDSDGDKSRNCASQVGSGWWFSGCNSKCNMFGFYPSVPALYPEEQRLRIDRFYSSSLHDQDVAKNWGYIKMYLDDLS